MRRGAKPTIASVMSGGGIAAAVGLKDGPHGVLWTHAQQINSELVAFLK
jgi:hypothetical protein